MNLEFLMRVTGERNTSLYQGKSNINAFLMRATGEGNLSLYQGKSNINAFLMRVTSEQIPSLSKGKSNLNSLDYSFPVIKMGFVHLSLA
jgi:hypothetical protein